MSEGYTAVKCKQHPEYQAKKYPTSECKTCLYIWNQKKNCDRIMAEVDRKYMEKLGAELEDCDICYNKGTVDDDVAHAMGGRWWRYCYCDHGSREAEKDMKAALAEKRKSPYKKCPTCDGRGEVLKEN